MSTSETAAATVVETEEIPEEMPGASRTSVSVAGNSSHNNTVVQFLLYAVLAGTSAAISGICTKIGVSTAATALVAFFLHVFGSSSSSGSNENGGDTRFATGVEYTVRVGMILLNAVFTAQMWRYLLKAMDLGPTAVAHGVVTGTNLAVSALCGVLLLGESMPGPLWAVGGAIAATGLFLVVSDEGSVGGGGEKDK